KVQHEKEKIKSYYVKLLKVILIVVTPLLAILFACAGEFVRVVYGIQWLKVIVPVQIMCAYGLIKTISSITEPIFLSKGRADIYLRVNLIRLAIFIPCILIGVKYGIIGVSIAMLVYSFVTSIPLFQYANKTVGLGNLFFYGVVVKYLILFVSTVFIVYSIFRLIDINGILSLPIQRLSIGIGVGILGYFGLGIIIIRDDLVFAIRFVRRTVQR
ncbi:MAG: oligosaccharide flippase family protein, partial [Nanoarchaeota archaeon]|nr:oligosaccharide flippase family protein [Nanoarchaeota archaeon]